MNPIRPMRLMLLSLLAVSSLACAFSFSDLSNQEAGSGLRAALDKGATVAVNQLGVQNGFLSNEEVKIHLPSVLEKAKPLLRLAGKGPELDELEVQMNHAAETAVPMAKSLLVEAVRKMSIDDAKRILTGGDTSVTDFFREKTSADLYVKFLPTVKGVTDRVGLARRYDDIMERAGRFGGVPDEEKTVEAYVTARALDGLYHMIAEEEKKIRQDPIGSGSKAIEKVFGLLRQ
ncbi:MAG TPA: DUF4197 domain-containing protein [Burkholderiaceae bacterium]